MPAIALREPWDDADDAIAELRRMGMRIEPGQPAGTWRVDGQPGYTAARIVQLRDNLRARDVLRRTMREPLPADPEPERPTAPLPASVAQFVLPRGPRRPIKTDQRREPPVKRRTGGAKRAALMPEQEAYLRDAWTKPVSLDEIGAKLGWTTPTLYRLAGDLNLGKKVRAVGGHVPKIEDDGEKAERFRRLWLDDIRIKDIAEEFELTLPTTIKTAERLGLPARPRYHRGRPLNTPEPKPKGEHDYRLSRFAHRPRRAPERVRGLAADNPAVIEGRTVYPHRVFDPWAGDEAILKSGHNNPKIGSIVRKGRWAGFPIYTLTLEERATCPSSCEHWRTCYGNVTNWGRRWRHGPALEMALQRDLRALQLAHPQGFAVRLHSLGDFYSAGYVMFWAWMLDTFPALHIWGYTAWPPESEIGAAILRLRRRAWDRFAIRFSNHDIAGTANTLRAEPAGPRTAAGLVCPEQLGRTAACATCGLCWAGDRKPAVDRIAFILH